jgi:tetratricopeptide (TPR) repeat protein
MLIAFLSKLDSKDIATLIVSCVALIVSLTSVAHAIISKSNEARKSAQADLAKAIEQLVDIKQTRETLRREQADDWGKNANSGIRIALNDKRELTLSRATYLVSKYKLDVSEISYTIIGAAFSDSGRHAESLSYYKKAVEVATTELSRAWARRVYGRALILAGSSERGRAEMLLAVSELQKLENVPGYDADSIRYDTADVFRRLVWAQIQAEEEKHTADDYMQLVSLTKRVRVTERRKVMEESVAELQSVFDKRRVTRMNTAGIETSVTVNVLSAER